MYIKAYWFYSHEKCLDDYSEQGRRHYYLRKKSSSLLWKVWEAGKSAISSKLCIITIIFFIPFLCSGNNSIMLKSYRKRTRRKEKRKNFFLNIIVYFHFCHVHLPSLFSGRSNSTNTGRLAENAVVSYCFRSSDGLRKMTWSGITCPSITFESTVFSWMRCWQEGNKLHQQIFDKIIHT